jgi:glycosyltransferase involved in cell wall biosynthesis
MLANGGEASAGTRPLFSVVTVTLNAGDALRTTADTLVAQTYGSYEHVVKDGGSTDGSLDFLARSGARVRIITASDSGIYDAMNQALRECRGEYVLFLNAGDELADRGALERVASSVSGQRPDILYCDLEDRDRSARITYPHRIGPFFFYRTTLCHQACFVRLQCYRENDGFDVGFRIAADHEFFARVVIGRGVKTAYSPTVATRYQGGGYSSLAKNRGVLAREVRIIRERHFKPVTRVLYSAALALTLPRLRVFLNTAPALKPARPIYAALVNAVYRVARSINRGAKW